MNSLTWFIYLANVIPNFGGLLTFVSMGSLVAIGIWLIVVAAYNSSWDVCNGRSSPMEFPSLKVFLLPLLTGDVATLVPSQTTIYTMLASEMGEEMAMSEAGQQVLNDLKEVVQYQLQELKGGNQ